LIPRLKFQQFGGTAIKLRIKLKIGTKIFITYFIILSVTVLVSLSAFHILSQNYLIAKTKEQLKFEGRIIADLYKNIPLTDTRIRENVINKKTIEVANRYINANIIVVNKDNKIVYSNISNPKQYSIASITNDKEFASVKIPVNSQTDDLKGYIILFSRVKDIKALNNLMINTQLLSLTIAIIIALIIGFVFERNLTKPLKKLKNSMIEFNLNDTRKIDIRTGDEIEDLANSFSQMSDKIRAYDERQRQFLQNVSHELKTPLMSIQGNAEGIKEGIIDQEDVNESLDIIINESQKLKNTINEIILLTKLENIDENYIFTICNINDIINNSINNIKIIATNENINIYYNKVDYLLNLDGEKMIRALNNILINCIRYAQNFIKIEVATNDNGFILIRVIDDGSGFLNGEENKVFDRFYKGKNGQTGLGLSITKAIIEGHNGEIKAYNNSPKGAVFEIYIPIRR